MITTWLLAHGPVPRGEVWSAWGRDPLSLIVVGMGAIAYVNGVLAARGRAALAPIVRRRAWYGAGALITLLVALVSPLEAAASTLFSLHMVQHLLLTVVAAPLLVLAAPVPTVRRGLAPAWAARLDRVGRVLRVRGGLRQWWPVPAALIGLGVLSAWHVPTLYDAALRSPLLHALEHATLLASSVILWSAVLGAARRRQLLWSIGALALAALHGAALGALLALSGEPWYATHAEGAHGWGIDALADQQAAGAIMWVPPAIVHLGALAVLIHRGLRDAERRATATSGARPSAAAGSVAP